MPDETLRTTSLYESHRDAGGRMVPFAGWEMPVQYTGILEECRAVRFAAGIFDISHMGRVHIMGPHAESLLDQLTPNDVRGLAPGRAHYSLLTNPEGGIIDDIIIYRLGESELQTREAEAETLRKQEAELKQEIDGLGNDPLEMERAIRRNKGLLREGEQVWRIETKPEE